MRQVSQLVNGNSRNVVDDPTIDSTASMLEQECHEADDFGLQVGMIVEGNNESVNLGTSHSNDPPVDWHVNDVWPFSNAWQWTYEDIYLPELMSTFDSADDIMSSSSLFDGHRPSQPGGQLATNALMSNALMTPASRSPQPADRELLGHCEDNARLQQTISKTRMVPDLETLIVQMVDLAASESAYSNRYNLNWHNFDLHLASVISISLNQQGDCGPPRWLDYLAQQYFEHFHPLWPLIIDTSTNLRSLHPQLFLTLTSIGALYQGTRSVAQFGSVLHSRIRDALIHKHIRSDQTAAEALDIGRSMLLTQVAALYFEQEKAFSAAQQLGAKLNSQAYRMQLFNQTGGDLPTEPGLWRETDGIVAESRRMLAYGILRAETFISVFFNRKPLLSYEEVNLPLPQIGFSENAANAFHVRSLVTEDAPVTCAAMLFSDLVRVALDEEEVLPMMKPTDLELLLFGLQDDVWRFCHDHGMFRRLTHPGQPDASNEATGGGTFASLGVDRLDQTSRKMRKALRDYNATVAALRRWKGALSQSQLSYTPDHDRSAYLSGLVLYELSFLRLSAPIDSILQVVHRHDQGRVDDATMQEVLRWTASEQAIESMTHAESIYQLLYAETSRPFENQAKYNILTLIAVHHAAAVTWAVIGGGRHQQRRFTALTSSEGASDLALVRENTGSIISHFANLYPKITASSGVQSSFHKIVKRLAHLTFPLIPVWRASAQTSK